jgi:hypothetical protein
LGVATFATYNPSALSVGGHNVQASFTAATISSVSYLGSTSGTLPLTVTKATPTVTVSFPVSPVTYDTNPHPASASVTGVGGADISGLGTLTITYAPPGDSTVPVNAGSYSASAHFASSDPNYNDADSITPALLTIDKAPTFTVVTVSNTTYNCSPQGGTAVVNGVGLPLNQPLPVKYIGRNTTVYGPTNTAPTDAGDYTAQARYMGDANHLDSHDSKDFTIAKADATFNVTGYHETYNCNAHTVTGTATGVAPCNEDLSSLLDLSGTTNTNAGDYPSDPWSFAGNNNYNAKNGTAHDIIDKADTTSSVTSNVNPSMINQNVTFTATVAGNPAVSCTPTGTVTFKDGATTLMAGVSLSGGQATFSTSSLPAGHRSITAVYSGDSNFNATGATPGSTAPIYDQWVQYKFIGFLPPVDNPPFFNSMKAGQTVPVKWQLTDFNNVIICDVGTLAQVNGLKSIQIACPSGPVVIDAIEEVLTSPGSTMFRCDGTQYIYNWQTSKSWAGTCRLMTVTLSDGTTHTALFTFK